MTEQVESSASAPPTALEMYMNDGATAPEEGEPVAEGAGESKKLTVNDPNLIWAGNACMSWTRCCFCTIPVRAAGRAAAVYHRQPVCALVVPGAEMVHPCVHCTTHAVATWHASLLLLRAVTLTTSAPVQAFWSCCLKPHWTFTKQVIKTRSACCGGEEESIHIASNLYDVSYARNCLLCCASDVTLYLKGAQPEAKVTTYHGLQVYNGYKKVILDRAKKGAHHSAQP